VSTPPLPTAGFVVPATHPCLPGHFPGRPVVPGVVLLDRAIEAARAAGLLDDPAAGARIPAAKFLRPVLPEERVTLRFARTSGGRLTFAGHVAGQLAFRGEIEWGEIA